jgi:4-diphosphocytidyl-2-C-methyl-D-erythritol kinase
MHIRQTVTVRAPAKINLTLYVLDRQVSGYHRILSLMQMVNLQDRLKLTRRPKGDGIRVVTTCRDLPWGRKNLIVQAARAFQKRYGIHAGLRIDLDKKIPIGAGLGGGSSDAAATLYGLCRLFRVPPARTELAALGLTLGSDIPFFFSGATAWVTGIGDEIHPTRLERRLWAVLVHPGFKVSTAWAYSELDRIRPKAPSRLVRYPKKIRLTLGRKRHKISSRKTQAFQRTKRSLSLHNDLELITIGRYPVIEMIKERLSALGAEGVLMSGSGSTVFGLFSKEASARSAASVLRRMRGRSSRNRCWTVNVARLLKRPPWLSERWNGTVREDLKSYDRIR